MNETFDIELNINEKSEFLDYYNKKDLDNSIRFLNIFNEINVLVGANNSGKSRFIRGLMNLKDFKGLNNVSNFFDKIKQYNDEIEIFDYKLKVNSGSINRLESKYGKDRIEILKFDQNEEFKFFQIVTTEKIDDIIENVNQTNFIASKFAVLYEYYQEPRRNNDGVTNFINSIYVNGSTSNSRKFFNSDSGFRKIQEIIFELQQLSSLYKNFNGGRIYIPTMRTAHSLFEVNHNFKVNPEESTLKKIKKDIYLDTVRKNYKQLNENIEIFTGLSLYNEIVNVRNSIKEERIKFHDFENFLSDNFFEGKDVDIVAKFNIDNSDKGIEDDDLIQIYIGGKSRKLHNLGDGIQSLIILMYKVFLAEEHSIIFIDEPELNLHPGYQRLFLEQITSNEVLTKKRLTYIIVTHSNHFLDLTLEKDNVSIYSFNSFQKNEEQKFIISNVNAGDNQTLRDLGVNNSSVFLANCSIWVEGVSDRNFIKAFLIAYCRAEELSAPREDIDFAFFEYAGSNLTHYNFRKGTNDTEEVIDLITSYALNNKILLISDMDSAKETKHNNIEEIASTTDGFEYYTTQPYREIENLISNSIWSKILLNFCNRKKVLGKEKKVQARIEQSLTKINSDSYGNKYIGSFLEALNIAELNKIYQIDRTKKMPGTFIQKAELSQLILQKVRDKEITWKDFSQNSTIVALTEAIYSFILKAKV